MNIDYKYNIKEARLYSVVQLESILSHKVRQSFSKLTMGIFALLCTTILSGFIYNSFFINPNQEIFNLITMFMPRAVGVALILFAFWLFVFLLDLFYRSFYFKELEVNYSMNKDYEDEDLLSFQVLRILARVIKGDITKQFLLSVQGQKIMIRCGITSVEISTYLKNRDIIRDIQNPPVVSGRLFTLKDLFIYLNKNDESFSNFIFDHAVTEKIFIGATDWVMRDNEAKKQKERWWSREHLASLGGLGTDFAYGTAYKLKQYSTEIHGSQSKNQYSFTSPQNKEQLIQLKNILARDRESNAVLVGPRGGGKMSLIYALAKDVFDGSVPSVLEGKSVVLVDTDLIISANSSKEQLEREIIAIVNDAVRAGNIIIVFKDFTEFILSAGSLNVNILNILDPYFTSNQIQIMVLAENEGFHQHLEQNTIFMQRFEKIIIIQPEEDESTQILELVAQELERKHGVLFTYQSIISAATGAKNYFQNPVMPEKAIDLLVELPARIKQQNKNIVYRNDVLNLIQEKTHIPLGDIDDKEREVLIHLERTLHERVIGQDKAVDSVAKALRRSRTGVRNMKRPIGSFLFLGSTGVGKTETAKALAEVFFGNEDSMSRIDMSEYRGDDAVDRLTGSFETGRVGVLTKLLKEKPYGVVLLDEFEKGSQKVHDLFLQILDEGFYSDAWGKRVNARNVIFIATSNAGSDMIWDYLNRGVSSDSVQKEIIDHIIKEGLFRPEFLNRFDSVVLFSPLSKEDIVKIAGIMLNSFKKRLRKKGLDLTITPELVKYVSDKGFDPVFGARPMTRFIKEFVEQIVAEKIIRGEIKEGSHFEITPEELMKL